MMRLFPGPAYRIQTERLVIRCWNPGDVHLLREAIASSIDHLLPWMPWAVDEPRELQAQLDTLRLWRSKFDRNEDFFYGIFDLEENRVLGGTGLHARIGPGGLEIGYWIRKEAVHQGLATETAAALTQVAFEVESVNRVEIHCDPQNLASAAVPHRLGFTEEAILRQRSTDAQGHWRDTQLWTLLREDYPHTPAAGAKIEVYDLIGRKILGEP
jgi:RimJ/RimL family protein N-acetyltransferase